MPDVEILTRDADIVALAAELLNDTVIAVDLEADALHNYQEKVCLLQFTGSKRTVLVDPLAADLTPLGPVLADPAIRKIFHAADYDLRCLRRDFGFVVNGLFDTMISAQFCGEAKIGLADVLGKYFEVVLDKKYQKADWSLRPLPEEMAHYAAEDTRHLHKLAQLLEAKLRELGRIDWVDEECRLLEQVRFAENGGPMFLKFKGAGTLDRRQLATLEALLVWRDSEARRRNRPLFKIIGNAQLLELARLRPLDSASLATVPGLSSGQAERYGRALLAAIAEAAALENSALPIYPRERAPERDPEVDRRMKRLKEWRQAKAAELSLDPGVMINNAALEAVARQQPRTVAELDALNGIKRWQVSEFGDELLTVYVS
jgi:ribonuclease D